MDIAIDVPDGVSGDWEVNSFEVSMNDNSQFISMLKYGRYVPAGTYKRLMRNGHCIMSNTPDEIGDFMKFVRVASGSILVNGLGLGVLLKALLNKSDVTDVTVIEKSEDVIKLVAPTYLKDSRVTIIHADAFEYNPPKGKRYDAVWHDIWDNICTDNLEGMKKLHRKYGRKARFQASWGRGLCEMYERRDRANGSFW